MTTIADKIARNIAAHESNQQRVIQYDHKQAWIAQFGKWKDSIIIAAETAIVATEFFKSDDCYEMILHQTKFFGGVYSTIIPFSEFENDEYTQEPADEFQKWLNAENLICEFKIFDDNIAQVEVYMVVSVAE